MGLFSVVNEETYIQKLVERSRSGKDLIPLLGGGISVASGIPIIKSIQEYLSCCILMALRGDENSAITKPWTPDEQWPAFNFFENAPPEFRRFRKTLTIDELNRSPIWKLGFGESSDWRRALNFLSRIDLDGNNRIILGPPRSSVIDSFFRHITRGKEPNLAHQMLAVLAGAGRIQLLLTINFDELLDG